MKDRQIWLDKMDGKDSIGIEDCPFCKDNCDGIGIIKKFKNWYIKKNLCPYNGIEQHLLLIPYRHIEHTKFLNTEELNELSEIYRFIEDFFSGENYFSFIRETNGGKSIKHIHYHYLPGCLYSTSLEGIMKVQHEILKENQKIQKGKI